MRTNNTMNNKTLRAIFINDEVFSNIVNYIEKKRNVYYTDRPIEIDIINALLYNSYRLDLIHKSDEWLNIYINFIVDMLAYDSLIYIDSRYIRAGLIINEVRHRLNRKVTKNDRY